MSLGVCCHWVRVERAPRSGKESVVNELEERSLLLGKWKRGGYTEDQVGEVYAHNTEKFRDALRRVAAAGVKLMRVSSGMFPLHDLTPKHLRESPRVLAALRAAGEVARGAGMRLTMHPGQFCVLSSDRDSVVETSIGEVEHHAWVMDAMGMPRSPFAAINVHGGKSGRPERLIEVIKSLPLASRSRLTLENCETCYSTVDLLPVAQATGVPLVWDSHHHTFNTGDITPEEASAATRETWPGGIKPLQHISNTSPHLMGGSFTDRRKHSDMIHYVPDVQLGALRSGEIDVEVEAKLKNIAVFDMSKKFNIPL